MTKKLIVQGFIVKPNVLNLDLGNESVVPIDVGSYEVPRDEMETWFTMQWPLILDNLKSQFEAAIAQQTATEPRAIKRARKSAKAAPKRKTPATVEAEMAAERGNVTSIKRAPVKKKR